MTEDEEALVQEIEQSDAFTQGIYKIVVRIDKACEASPTTPTTSSGTGTEPVHHSSHSRAKLPKLTLRAFDGDVTKWLTFWDSYDAAIHTNRDLSDINKFTYLRTLVERS